MTVEAQLANLRKFKEVVDTVQDKETQRKLLDIGIALSMSGFKDEKGKQVYVNVFQELGL